jgi:hypothetical protein
MKRLWVALQWTLLHVIITDTTILLAPSLLHKTFEQSFRVICEEFEHALAVICLSVTREPCNSKSLTQAVRTFDNAYVEEFHNAFFNLYM